MPAGTDNGSADGLLFDVVVIGCGVAGLSAAITAAELGARVAVLSKEAVLEESNTRYAQGGIVGHGERDSQDLLQQDILDAGGLPPRPGPRLL